MNQVLVCEAKGCPSRRATHVYGPECEMETGGLMYLCSSHTMEVRSWTNSHPHDPVFCPTHGFIGRVKDYLVLKALRDLKELP